jgi:hypothetical protein
VSFLLAFALVAVGSGGGTVVQTAPLPGTGTGQFQDFDLAQFDTQGGALRLDAVTVNLFTSVIGGGTSTSSGVPTTVIAQLDADVWLGAQLLVETQALINGVIPNNGPAFSFTLFDTDEGETVLATPGELAPWVGAGSITLTSFTEIFIDEQPASTVFFGAGGGSTYTVTYTYSDVATSYCSAGTSASGCQASVSAAGAPSATATSGFQLAAAGVEGQKDALFFFGANGRQANAWGNGTSYQCVVPPVSRAGLLAGTGTVAACDGAFGQDLNALWCPTCPKPHKNPGAGSVVQAQLWYRDPASTSNRSTSLSDALEFCVGP